MQKSRCLYCVTCPGSLPRLSLSRHGISTWSPYSGFRCLRSSPPFSIALHARSLPRRPRHRTEGACSESWESSRSRHNGLIVIFRYRRLHNHFAEHAAHVAATRDQEHLAEAQEANQERLAHEKRLAWQQAHPAEYARQRTEARAAAKRREQQERAEQTVLAAQQAAKLAENRKQRAAGRLQYSGGYISSESEVYRFLSCGETGSPGSNCGLFLMSAAPAEY
jgi:hypothetical protein